MRIRGNARYAPAARNESQTAAARPWFGRTRNFKQLLQTNSSAAMIYSMPTSRSILSNCHNRLATTSMANLVVLVRFGATKTPKYRWFWVFDCLF